MPQPMLQVVIITWASYQNPSITHVYMLIALLHLVKNYLAFHTHTRKKTVGHDWQHAVRLQHVHHVHGCQVTATHSCEAHRHRMSTLVRHFLVKIAILWAQQRFPFIHNKVPGQTGHQEISALRIINRDYF